MRSVDLVDRSREVDAGHWGQGGSRNARAVSPVIQAPFNKPTSYKNMGSLPLIGLLAPGVALEKKTPPFTQNDVTKFLPRRTSGSARCALPRSAVRSLRVRTNGKTDIRAYLAGRTVLTPYFPFQDSTRSPAGAFLAIWSAIIRMSSAFVMGCQPCPFIGRPYTTSPL